ncbi:MAG: glycosyltransferase family 2 protein [Betaproteobacteria bacterium]
MNAASSTPTAVSPGSTRPRLSVIVITKNEEAVIRRCLESVQWADEIVVVDSGSTDGTVEIARQLGARTFVTPDWPGPGPQRNRAIDQVTAEWILALDADEWVSTELRDEIVNALGTAGELAGYRIPRLSSYCGRRMRHGGWWPDYVSRLFRRGHARFGGGIVHDHLIPEGPLGKLRNPLLHEAITDLDDMLNKLNSYSSWGAQTLHEKGRRAGLGTALGHGAWTFLKTYFFRAGFLDGREGFMLAVSNAEGAYYKYLKLMLMNRNSRRAQ